VSAFKKKNFRKFNFSFQKRNQDIKYSLVNVKKNCKNCKFQKILFQKKIRNSCIVFKNIFLRKRNSQNDMIFHQMIFYLQNVNSLKKKINV
jgi:hypothetical protein